MKIALPLSYLYFDFRRNNLKDLVRLLRQEKYQYIDPLTEFVECIHVTYNFEEAQKKLVECLTVMEHDFFLQVCTATNRGSGLGLMGKSVAAVFIRSELRPRLSKCLIKGRRFISASPPFMFEIVFEGRIFRARTDDDF